MNPLDPGKVSQPELHEMSPAREAGSDDRHGAPSCGRTACPVCGGPLIERRGKLVCSRCRTICETCCEGGRG